MDEEEEKEKFFANLEKGASSTIDYSRLNKELDSTNSTVIGTLRNNEEKMAEVTTDKSSNLKPTITNGYALGESPYLQLTFSAFCWSVRLSDPLHWLAPPDRDLGSPATRALRLGLSFSKSQTPAAICGEPSSFRSLPLRTNPEQE
ncbi:CE162 protein, partial [Polypterus senegalus]